ncbi:MAG: ABC transporter permease, partial [Chloroflexota bacterium]
ADINSIGTNQLTIFTNTENSGGYPSLTLADMEALADPLNAPSLSDVSALVQANADVIYDRSNQNVEVSGVTASYFPINNLVEFVAGDALYQPDIDSAARTVVVGYNVAADLFDDEFPIGREIRIDGVGYEVVGILTERGQGPGTNPDDALFIPITTAQDRLNSARTRSGEKAVTRIVAEAANENVTDAAIEEITEVLRDRHGIIYADEDDFEIFSQASLLDTIGNITGILTAFLGAIAGISLVVGGIGIMNIMLVSVTERTREIGIRKAIGALRRDILLQFLLESIVLSLFGCLIGIGLGYLISYIASLFDFSTVITTNSILLSVGFATIVGLVFGIYPAWRAANLRPIEALRYE